MHHLSRRDKADGIGRRYARDSLLPWYEDAASRQSGLPVVADGFGYSQANFTEVLEDWTPMTLVPLYLLWIHDLYREDPTSSEGREDLDEVTEAYENGANEFELLSPLAPFSQLIVYKYEGFDVDEEDPADLLSPLMMELAMSEPGYLLELIDRLDGMAFDVLRNGYRLAFLESTYDACDPEEPSPGSFSRSRYVDHLNASEEMCDSVDGAYWASVNPYKGGGFSCMI